MEFERFANHYVLRLDPGEKVMAVLRDFVARENICGGYFIAFGGFSRVRLRYFDVSRKEYEDSEGNEQVEVGSLLGNIAWENSNPILHMHSHMHSAVSDAQARTYSGHIGEGTVNPTLEVFLTKFDGEVRREKDSNTGLELLALKRRATVGRE